MKNTLLGAISFLLTSLALGLVLTILSMVTSPAGQSRPDPTGDFLMVMIYYGSTNGIRAIGFLIPTALSPAWRRWLTWRAVMTAGLLGLTSPITAMLVLAVIAKSILPLFHSAPWLAMALSNGVPGVVLGAVAVLVARAWRLRKPA